MATSTNRPSAAQPRHPAGIPVGGQFATRSALEGSVALDLPSEDPPEEPTAGRRGVATRVHRPDLIGIDTDLRAALDAIRSTGGRPMLVGGCVRDPLTDPTLASKDIDIEVYGCADVDALADALSDVGQVDEVGKSFGVIKVRVGDTDLDVSLPRRDSKVGAGHRGFSVESDAEMTEVEASGRRDFTMNSLMWDPSTGDVVDCWGGMADIEAGVLRHTTDAFAEDPLRVLRGVQFASRFGARFAPETAALCQSLSDAYAELPKERVWGEWEKFATKGRHPSVGLEELRATGWDQHFPQFTALYGVPQDQRWHPEGPVEVHTGQVADHAVRLADQAGLSGEDRFVAVMGALVHDFGKAEHTQIQPQADGTVRVTSHGHDAGGVAPAAEFLAGVGCPRHLMGRIAPLIREHMCCVTGEPTPAAVRRLVRRLVPATVAEWALVTGADHAGRGDPHAPNPADAWVAMAQRLGVSHRPAKGILTGDHLIAAGMKPGREFTPILAAALAAQDDGEFSDEAGALAWFARRA